MSLHDREIQELSHIETMIRQLERLLEGNSAPPASAVMTPAYWRKRINTVLAAPALPPAVAEQASALLTRLDHLPSGVGNDGWRIHRERRVNSRMRDSRSSGPRPG